MGDGAKIKVNVMDKSNNPRLPRKTFAKALLARVQEIFCVMGASHHRISDVFHDFRRDAGQ